jgi:hypothetical protein
MRRRKDSAYYKWYPPHECYRAAWSPSYDPPGTRRIEGLAIGRCGSGGIVLEVTEFPGSNGVWHVSHNEVFRIENSFRRRK